MKVKKRNEVLNDIIKDAKKQPKGWKAAFGKDPKHLSNDYYIFNPEIGIYLLKEYHKNPYEVKGVGGKVARNIDDDILKLQEKKPIDFGIVQGNIPKLARNIQKGIRPEEIFHAALKGKDLGLSLSLKGRASTSKQTYSEINNVLSPKQRKLNSSLDKMITDDGLYRSYD